MQMCSQKFWNISYRQVDVRWNWAGLLGSGVHSFGLNSDIFYVSPLLRVAAPGT